MRPALALPAWGRDLTLDMELVRRAEHLGYDSVWATEAWGSDAVTVLTWIAAGTTRLRVGSGIMQIPARTPSMTAMTAATLNELSDGRFILGLGMSGPQVVEGWHGRPYGKPIARTREYVAIVRAAMRRREPLTHAGEHYRIPAEGPGTTGLGKPLKMSIRPHHDLPIYLAALGPRNVRLAAEIADGWIPTLFSPFRHADVFAPHLEQGFAASPGQRARAFDIAPMVQCTVTDDPRAARRRARSMLAFYIGGMGAANRNFYNDLARRYGFESAAASIQQLYLGGNRRAAAEAVPDDLIDEVCLIGSAAEIRDRLEAWKDAGVGTLILAIQDEHTLHVFPDLLP